MSDRKGPWSDSVVRISIDGPTRMDELIAERDSAIRRAEEAEKIAATSPALVLAAAQSELAAQMKDHDDTYEQLHAAQAECAELRRVLEMATIGARDFAVEQTRILSQPSCSAPLLQAIKGVVGTADNDGEQEIYAAIDSLRPYVTGAK